jgi:hypothetical protein
MVFAPRLCGMHLQSINPMRRLLEGRFFACLTFGGTRFRAKFTVAQHFAATLG